MGEVSFSFLPSAGPLFNSIAISLTFSRVVFPITVKPSLGGIREAPRNLIPYGFLLCLYKWIHLPHSMLGFRNPFILSRSTAFFRERGMGLCWRTSHEGAVVSFSKLPDESLGKWEHFNMLVSITCSAQVCTIIPSKLLSEREMLPFKGHLCWLPKGHVMKF